jgi:hypothetical protein
MRERKGEKRDTQGCEKNSDLGMRKIQKTSKIDMAMPMYS